MGNLLDFEEHPNNNQRQYDLQWAETMVRMAQSNKNECLEDITDQWTRFELRNIVKDYNVSLMLDKFK